MKVREVYERAILAIETDESLKDAAVRMHNHAIGCLAVYRNGETIGILTERDIMRALAEGADPATSAAGDYMTAGVVTVTPETELVVAARRMVELGARHLPVVDDSGGVMGMLSARDLVSLFAAEVPAAIANG